MSTPIRDTTFLAGSPRSSGDIQTGEVAFTRGGGRTVCAYSGAIAMGVAGAGSGSLSSGGSVLFYTGPGRLNSFTALFPAGVALTGNGEAGVISGQPIVIYDSAITARSGLAVDGTIAESGRKILYSWYPPRVLSGMAPNIYAFDPKPLDIPFQSGLCAMALSGAPGFSITFTPECSILDNGTVTGG